MIKQLTPKQAIALVINFCDTVEYIKECKDLLIGLGGYWIDKTQYAIKILRENHDSFEEYNEAGDDILEKYKIQIDDVIGYINSDVIALDQVFTLSTLRNILKKEYITEEKDIYFIIEMVGRYYTREK